MLPFNNICWLIYLLIFIEIIITFKFILNYFNKRLWLKYYIILTFLLKILDIIEFFDFFSFFFQSLNLFFN